MLYAIACRSELSPYCSLLNTIEAGSVRHPFPEGCLFLAFFTEKSSLVNRLYIKWSKQMKKKFGFWKELNKVIDDWADNCVANYHDSILRLLGIEMLALFLSLAGLFCLVVCLVYLWLPFSYPWYAIPGAVLSPLVTWRSFHIIRHVNWHLVQL